MTSDPIRAALERLLQQLAARRADPYSALQLEHAEREARAALAAAPEGKGPTDAEIIAFWSERCAGDGDDGIIRLARWGRSAALAAAPEGEASDKELIRTYANAVAAAVDAHPGAFNQEDVQAAQLAGLRAVLARWGYQPARLRNCPTHGQQPPEAWGCPECVRELREGLAAARLHQPALAAAPEGEPSGEELDLLVITIQALAPHQPDATTHNLASVDRGREILSEALARWGRPAAPPAPLEGEVGELVAMLIQEAGSLEAHCNKTANGECRTLACLQRGGYLRSSGLLDPSVATCPNLEKAGIKRRAATLLQQLSAAAPAVVPVAVSKALIKAECALADVAEGERWCDEGDLLQWAERRCAKALASIRPVMKQHQIRTSEWPPLPAPQGEEGQP